MNKSLPTIFTFFVLNLFLLQAVSAQQNYYYPPNSGNTWQTLSPDSLGWCPARLDSSYHFLADKNTKSFIVLKEGKIVLEKYFDSFTKDSVRYYASAGNSVLAFLSGIA